MKTKDGRNFEYDSSCNEIFITWWRNNEIVTVDSTCHAELLLESVKYAVMSFKTKSVPVKSDENNNKIKNIQIPRLIRMCTKFMGSTYLMDENINRYRFNIRSKKWYWPVNTWLVDATIPNAWKLCKIFGKEMKQL